MGKRKIDGRAKKYSPLNMPPGWPDKYKITIASAGYGMVHAEFCYSLAVAVKVLQCPSKLDYEGGCYVHRNRNNLLDRALKSDSTHLMFIDTDIAFPPDGIPRLVSAQKPIIGGAYNLKKDPKNNVATTTVKALERDLKGRPHEEWIMDKSKPFECAGIPTGFMLIELDALRDIERRGEAPEFGGDRAGSPNKGPRNWFDFGNYAGFVGEDIYFCHYLRDRGVPIWCDPTIPLGHIGPKVY